MYSNKCWVSISLTSEVRYFMSEIWPNSTSGKTTQSLENMRYALERLKFPVSSGITRLPRCSDGAQRHPPNSQRSEGISVSLMEVTEILL